MEILTRAKLSYLVRLLPSFNSVTCSAYCLDRISNILSCQNLPGIFAHSSIYSKNIRVIRSIMSDTSDIPCDAAADGNSVVVDAKDLTKTENGKASTESTFNKVSFY